MSWYQTIIHQIRARTDRILGAKSDGSGSRHLRGKGFADSESSPVESIRSRNTSERLLPGMKLHGTVSRLELHGAFVNIGASQDALLHISQMNLPRVRNVADTLKVGDEIVVSIINPPISAVTGRVLVSLVDFTNASPEMVHPIASRSVARPQEQARPAHSRRRIATTSTRTEKKRVKRGRGKLRKPVKTGKSVQKKAVQVPANGLNPERAVRNFWKQRKMRHNKQLPADFKPKRTESRAKNLAGFDNNSNDWDELIWKTDVDDRDTPNRF